MATGLTRSFGTVRAQQYPPPPIAAFLTSPKSISSYIHNIYNVLLYYRGIPPNNPGIQVDLKRRDPPIIEAQTTFTTTITISNLHVSFYSSGPSPKMLINLKEIKGPHVNAVEMVWFAILAILPGVIATAIVIWGLFIYGRDCSCCCRRRKNGGEAQIEEDGNAGTSEEALLENVNVLRTPDPPEIPEWLASRRTAMEAGSGLDEGLGERAARGSEMRETPVSPNGLV